MEAQSVQIKCKGAGVLPISVLVPFQGNLKSLSQENYQKLKLEILTLGFSEPISTWKHEGQYYILNGHQRMRTLVKMQEEGILVPKIPVNYIEADSYKQAKMKVLALTSQYGQIEEDGLYEFTTDAEITPDELLESFSFPEVDLNEFVEGYFTEGNPEKKGKKPRPITCPKCQHTFTV